MTERSPASQGRATHEPGLATRPGHSVGVPNALQRMAKQAEAREAAKQDGYLVATDIHVTPEDACEIVREFDAVLHDLGRVMERENRYLNALFAICELVGTEASEIAGEALR